MRKIITLVTSCALVAFLSIGVGGAHAQTGLTGAVSGAGSVTNSGGASLNPGSATSGTSVTGSGSAAAGSSHGSVQSGVGASGAAQAGMGSSANGSASASGNGANATAGGTGISVSLTRNSASANLQGDGAGMTAGSVVSPNDLSRFATASFQQDSSLQSIDATNNHVAVAYTVPARFLGFIPASLTAQTTVSQDGSVTISYPWYHFLFSVPNAVTQANLSASLQGVLLANANGSFDAMTEAQIIQLIRDAFSHATAGAQAQNSAGAGMNGTAASNGSASTSSGY